MAKAIQKANELKENHLTESNRLKENIQKLMLERYYSIVKGREKGNPKLSVKPDKKIIFNQKGYDTQISITMPCLPQYLNEEDEELIFNKVEKLLQSFKMEPNLLKQIIRYIKISEESAKQPDNAEKDESLIKHLTLLEQKTEAFNMAETFTTASVEDKYQIINAVFARLEMNCGKLSFTLRPPFGLFMQNAADDNIIGG